MKFKLLLTIFIISFFTTKHSQACDETYGQDTQVHCDSFTWTDGITYTNNNNSATDTLVNAEGCDSIVTLNLTITHNIDPVPVADNVTGNSATISWPNTSPDNYLYQYRESGNTWNQFGTAMGIGPAGNPDTTIQLNSLSLNTSYDFRVKTYFQPGGPCPSSNSWFDVSFTTANCLDTYGTDTQVHCDSYIWMDGNTYTNSNNFATHTLVNSAGCDSVVTLNLTINNSSTGTDTQVHCDSYTWIDGNTYTNSNNSATHTLVNSIGCDSVVTLNLTINNSSTGTDTQVHCDSYTWIDGNTYTNSNNFATHTLVNSAGCDSVVTLNLTINNSSTGTDTQVHCDSYTWIDGNTYTSSNNFATHTLVNSAGCDSVVTLNLTINNSSTGTDTQVHCDSYTWIDGNTYTNSNNSATHTLVNSVGCDSVVTLNLTINNSSTSNTDITACDEYTWNNFTYTISGTYTYNTTAASGCDSVTTLNLSLLNSGSPTTETVVQCGSFTWIDGNTYTTSNNTATHILSSANGCDSIILLNLSINPNYNISNNVEICSGESVTVGGNIYTQSGTYSDTLVSSLGCDSLITTQLTVEPLSALISQSINMLNATTLSGNAPFTYLWNMGETSQSITPALNGEYWLIVEDASACLSDTLFFNVSFVSTNDVSQSLHPLVIFPNPSNDVFTVTFNSSEKQNIHLRIVNLLGEVVYNEHLFNFDGSYKKKIEMTAQSSTIFILELNTESGTLKRKIMLNR
jgi:riboflavin synthase